MNKEELVTALHKKTELPKGQAETLVNALTGIIRETMAAGDSLTLSGLGTLKPVTRAARSGRNPRTGEEIRIPATRTVKFVPGKTLKDALN